MSSGVIESKGELHHGTHVDVQHSEVLKDQILMGDAFDGENREHELGAWEAVKSHPWACFWAFTMCFTIVRTTLLKETS